MVRAPRRPRRVHLDGSKSRPSNTTRPRDIHFPPARIRPGKVIASPSAELVRRTLAVPGFSHSFRAVAHAHLSCRRPDARAPVPGSSLGGGSFPGIAGRNARGAYNRSRGACGAPVRSPGGARGGRGPALTRADRPACVFFAAPAPGRFFSRLRLSVLAPRTMPLCTAAISEAGRGAPRSPPARLFSRGGRRGRRGRRGSASAGSARSPAPMPISRKAARRRHSFDQQSAAGVVEPARKLGRRETRDGAAVAQPEVGLLELERDAAPRVARPPRAARRPSRTAARGSASSASSAAIVALEGGLGGDALGLAHRLDAAPSSRPSASAFRRSPSRPATATRRAGSARASWPMRVMPACARRFLRHRADAGDEPDRALPPGRRPPRPPRSRRSRGACRGRTRSWPGTCWARAPTETVIPILALDRAREARQRHRRGGAVQAPACPRRSRKSLVDRERLPTSGPSLRVALSWRGPVGPTARYFGTCRAGSTTASGQGVERL